MGLLKLTTTQNKPKRALTTYCNPQPATTIHDQFFLPCPQSDRFSQSLTNGQALFTWAFRR